MIKKAIYSGIFIGLSIVAVAQKKADHVSLSDTASFSMVLLPDPQNYIKYDYNQPVFELMTAWVTENRGNLNVKAVLCTGDLVDQNESLLPATPRHGNISSKKQWQSVSRAFERLDNKIPYIISPGNHDYGFNNAETPYSNFPAYFAPERNGEWDNKLISVFRNRNGVPTLENAAYSIEGPGWGKLLVVAIEFAPRSEVMNWVKKIAGDSLYRNRKVILLTHSYMGTDTARLGKQGYLINPAYTGNELWEKLIYVTPNIRMVLCGHHAIPDESFEHNAGFRSDRNIAGRTVHQMMFNAQALGGGMSGNGGDGWLRILEFKPDGKTVRVQTYSPLFGFSPSTKNLARRTAPYDQFEFVIE